MPTHVWIELPLETGGGGGGSVNSVTASDPLFSSMGTDPNISFVDVNPNLVLAGPTSGPAAEPTFRALTPADIGTFPANSFVGTDNSGLLESIPGFTIDTTSGGMDENLTEQPNNVGGGFNVNIFNVSFEPLQNSPNDSWNIQSLQVFLDNANSGFTQGTSGSAVQLLNLNFTHHGTGNVGRLNFIGMNSDLGNGTDPIDIAGFSYSNGFTNIHDNVTISQSIQGYGFQPNMSAAAFSGTNMGVNPFYDFSTLQVPIYGYTVLTGSPNILSVANNHNFTGFSLFPTITSLLGNAGYQAVEIGGNIGSAGSTSSYFAGLNYHPGIANAQGNMQGVNINPQFSSLSGSMSFTGININPYGGQTLHDPQGISINMSQILSDNPQGMVGFSCDSRMNVNSQTTLQSSLGFQIGHRIENLFQIPNGSPVTGTACLGLDLAGDLEAQDNLVIDGSGIGFISVGFIADMAVASGKTVDKVTAFFPAVALLDPGFPTGGSVGEMNMIRVVAPAPEGGTVSITNLYAFHLDNIFGSFGASATNAWGLFLNDTQIKNKLGGGLLYQTNTKSSTYTIDSGTVRDNVVLTNSSGGAFSITLPIPEDGRQITVKDSTGNALANNVTILPHATEKIDGASSYILNLNYESATLISNGTDWFII